MPGYALLTHSCGCGPGINRLHKDLDNETATKPEGGLSAVKRAWGASSLEGLMVKHLMDGEFDIVAMGLDMTVQAVCNRMSRYACMLPLAKPIPARQRLTRWAALCWTAVYVCVWLCVCARVLPRDIQPTFRTCGWH